MTANIYASNQNHNLSEILTIIFVLLMPKKEIILIISVAGEVIPLL